MFNFLFGWIKCKKIPEEDRIYVVLDCNYKHVGMAYVKDGKWRDRTTHMDYEYSTKDYELKVTHYFPLPKFPKR